MPLSDLIWRDICRTAAKPWGGGTAGKQRAVLRQLRRRNYEQAVNRRGVAHVALRREAHAAYQASLRHTPARLPLDDV